MKNILFASLIASVASIASAQPYTGVSIFDDSFSLFNGATQITAASSDLEARFGTFSGGVFTPFLGAAAVSGNDGYVGDPVAGFFELSVTLSLANNSLAPLDSLIYLVITNIADGGSYASSPVEAVLTDPSWKAPAIDAFAAEAFAFNFTTNTTALKGTFAFNGGNETINLTSTVIPEPSTYAALAGVAVLGLAALRRRRA
jgi:hypothetical protein